MVKKTLEIHSENIMPIIKKWLYSDKDIFVRELTSNACDAIHKVKLLGEGGDDTFKVSIEVDKEARTLKFIDNGIGMDAEEVQKYIAQIAFSSAEEFLDKYQSNDEKDQFIGHFGLGFYSAYMVAEKVEINTLSYKEGAEPVLWSCDGSSEYELEKGTREVRGTEITLYINKESDEFLEEARLKQILNHYCSFMMYPVYLGETHINHKEPLWVKAPSECKEEDYLEFYRHLYPMEEDPLFWVHLNVDYPFHLKGVLYFPKIRRDFDLKQNSVKLFCNRVFVSDNCQDVIPNYLTVMRGVIDSPDIPLNVSRSYLQMDRTVRQLGNHISKKVSDSLSTRYRNEKEKFIEAWEDISLIVKLGAIEDDKFYDRVKSLLIWKNTEGEWTTVEEYLERNREKNQEKVFYTTDGGEHPSPIVEMYRGRGVEILCTPAAIDTHMVQLLERKLDPVKFQRVDAGIDDHIIDKEREDAESGKLADFIRSKLGNDKIEVEAKSLAADSLPGFIMMDENQRRFRDYMMSMDPSGKASEMMEKHTLVINTNNPLMSAIQDLDKVNPELTGDMIRQVYDTARLAQREIDPKDLNAFIVRNNRVLEQLVAQALGKEHV